MSALRCKEAILRPVDKGVEPLQAYATYRDAAPDLVAQLGRYCSYCERKIETHLAVEHVQPKLLEPDLAYTWLNFLLACVNCNSCKGSTAIALADYLWPDVDNTLRAYCYLRGGVIEPSPALDIFLKAKAVASLALTGLDRYPSGPGPTPTRSDLRWKKRFDVWKMAHRALCRLHSNDSIILRDQIVETAKEAGLFSIWWSVFDSDVDMRRRLRDAFPGTHGASFDTDENLVPRAGGQV